MVKEDCASFAIMKAVLAHIDGYHQQRQVIQTRDLDQSIQIVSMYQAKIGPRRFSQGLLYIPTRLLHPGVRNGKKQKIDI